MARRTSTEQLEKAARLANAMHALYEESGVISVNGIGRPSVLLTTESFKEAFGERDIEISEKNGHRFYSYFDGQMVWETNEQIKKEAEHEETA